MNLSDRLQTVARGVQLKGVVADIGCDHGFTSIYLIQNQMAEHVIAMDINEGPLERAKEHVLQYNMEQRISLRLSDGAKELAEGEADTLLISGMGGALICRILQESEAVTKSAKELVLSPQSEIYLVRHLLHDMGFRIVGEKMVLEQGKYYVVIRAVPGVESYPEETDYIYGKILIDNKDEVFCGFLKKEAERVARVLDVMKQQKLSEKSQEKREELIRESVQIQEVRNRMNRKHDVS